jgi:hypothetical protein
MKSIIELAKMAGFPAPELMVPAEGRCVSPDLSFFAQLVRAEVLEEAAVYFENHWSYEWTDDQVVAAIRALKRKEKT